jgi:hypothetical protein
MTHSTALSSTVSANNRTPVKTESEESDGVGTGSDNVSESEGEDRSAAYNEQPQAPPTARVTAPQVTTVTPLTRGAVPPQRDARATTTENPSARARTTTDNTARQQVASGTNANRKNLIYFFVLIL